MENINKIINNNLYKESLENLKKYEEDRKFCNHTIEHFIDVARIASILVLEENINVSKEVIVENVNLTESLFTLSYLMKEDEL